MKITVVLRDATQASEFVEFVNKSALPGEVANVSKAGRKVTVDANGPKGEQLVDMWEFEFHIDQKQRAVKQVR